MECLNGAEFGKADVEGKEISSGGEGEMDSGDVEEENSLDRIGEVKISSGIEEGTTLSVEECSKDAEGVVRKEAESMEGFKDLKGKMCS